MTFNGYRGKHLYNTVHLKHTLHVSGERTSKARQHGRKTAYIALKSWVHSADTVVVVVVVVIFYSGDSMDGVVDNMVVVLKILLLFCFCRSLCSSGPKKRTAPQSPVERQKSR